MSHTPEVSGDDLESRRPDTAAYTTHEFRLSTTGSDSDNEPHQELNQPSNSSYVFETEFANHRTALSEGNIDKALHSFVMLQTNSPENETFQKYLIELADHIDPSRDTNMSRFFATLPTLIQSTIIENVTDILEETDGLRAFQVLFDYTQAYPRHAYKYLIRAIKLLLACAQNMKQDDHRKCMQVLVTELFPRLWKTRILLTKGDKIPSVKSTDSKHFIVIPYSLFEQYLLLGQQYYIERRQWDELNKFTCNMLECCGYKGLGRLGFLPHTNRFQHLKEQRSNIRLDREDDQERSSSPETNELATSIVFMCEFKAVTAQFVQFSYEYYRAVCALDASDNEKTCLIPICTIQPSLVSPSTSKTVLIDTMHPAHAHRNMKNGVETQPGTDAMQTTESRSGVSHRRESDLHDKKGKLTVPQLVHDVLSDIKPLLDTDVKISNRGEGLNAYCMRGVDEALQLLSRAADCMRHVVELWNWAVSSSSHINWESIFGGWEQELCRVIDTYRLPFDIYNAVLLVRSDLALSSPSITGNLSKALKLSQMICDRIEAQRRRERSEHDKQSKEFDIPFMFAFRVLYNIGVIYLLVGSLQQSTLEIAIILSVFPISDKLSEVDFLMDEMDCDTAASIFHGHEFGMMRVSREGLVVRCIKHLIVSLDSASAQRGGMASIDSAMRWDSNAGAMMVLMQIGWPYWSSRTNFWQRIVQRMCEKHTFRNRVFLEYVYVPDILNTIKKLHERQAVMFDIIPPEFALRSSYRHLASSASASAPGNLAANHHPIHPSSSSATSSLPTSPLPTPASPPNSEHHHHDHDRIEDHQSRKLPSIRTLPLSADQAVAPRPPPMYKPSFTDTSLPSMSMSPSWYTASTQKNLHNNWMSPSFYYSREEGAPVIPKKRSHSHEDDTGTDDVGVLESMQRPVISNDLILRCLEHRMRRYSPKLTPQKLRHVVQKFLKNMVLEANEETA
ncbi:uncharacterized protein BYT42DRAFT_609912 [Radiomyces spectabilis]|uniref:uncharacterized protein n=1 Tax=Radiomyces spectabilis TaxID=64574 RepID=UPI00221F8404|nr:uncharacterized protein BYT42DRAFT_609912 [Radiomyces spectabilis]KAI8394177.1 hypothetical protein BYT42DRAFT_609912 [Radiomyces spectabilis]